MKSLEFLGVRGGHGATTVALATAVTLAARRPTRIAAHDPAMLCAVAGAVHDGLPFELADQLELADPDAADVIDAAVLGQPKVAASGGLQGGCEPFRIGVLRGPDYLGLRTLCGYSGPSLDGIVVVAEPGRALDARDVEAVAGIPVVAVVDHSPAVARLIDAGLFVHRVARCREFTRLRTWTDELVVGSQSWSAAS